jgi:hypothetical protein
MQPFAAPVQSVAAEHVGAQRVCVLAQPPAGPQAVHTSALR